MQEYKRKWRAANREKNRQYEQEYYQRNVEKRRAAARAYHAKHRDRINPIQRKRNREAYQRNPDAFRASMLRSRFGLAVDQYNHMVKEQHNRCAICKKRPAPPKRLCVDHCHQTGRIRGLLCSLCNLGIGHMQDDPQIVRAALHYLLK